MTREDRIAAAVAALPEPCREPVAPLVRQLIHDLNGIFSTMTMEAFAISQLAMKLGSDAAGREMAGPSQPTQSLQDAARNLRQAAEEGANYLACVETLASDLEPQQ